MYIFLKLIFDKILSLTLILIFIPIFFFLIFINFTLNGSPIFFIQERSGMNKKKIYLIKLRTIKNDCKDINKIKGAKVVKALLEEQNSSIKSQIKAVPVIFIYKDRSVIGRWDADISLTIKAPVEEMQDVINESKYTRRASTN